jgi:hypothetical protein
VYPNGVINVIVPITKRIPTKTYNGFAVPLQAETDLGNAILIAEDEETNYEPIAVAATIREGKELAQSDLRSRLRRLERDEDPGLCPWQSDSGQKALMAGSKSPLPGSLLNFNHKGEAIYASL